MNKKTKKIKIPEKLTLKLNQENYFVSFLITACVDDIKDSAFFKIPLFWEKIFVFLKLKVNFSINGKRKADKFNKRLILEK